MQAEAAIKTIIKPADIKIDGDRPWDIQVHDSRIYKRVLATGSLGLGDAYMDGWWDCQRLDELFDRILRADLRSQIKGNWQIMFGALRAVATNMQSPSRAFQIGKQHYDVGNDLFSAMLDPYMIYSCGYWNEAKTLAAAQEAKLKLICEKLGLKSGMKLLDIGCGWGGLLRYAAEHYGVQGVGVTVSKEQAELARKLAGNLPVEIKLQDYRDTTGHFDRVVSVGMVEHVGYKNYRTFMEVAHRVLRDGGLFLLHTIGGNVSVRTNDPWIEKHIFPNSMIPSVAQIGRSIENLFVMEDWHNFGTDYDKTLMSWHQNFEAAWPELSRQNPKYDERFHRMWRYYLLCSAGSFRSRENELWQVVLSKGYFERYQPVR